MNINKEQVQRKDSKDVCIEFGDEDDQVLDYTNHQLKNGKIYSSDYEKRVSQDYMMNTEQSYVRELASLVENYMVPFENLENTNTLAPAVRGKSHIIFGNLRGLLEYHNNVFLSELLAAADDVTSICHIFVRERHHLLSLYRPYCQNKSHSESFRKEYVEGKKFFVECQKRAGHPLPLSAYLLKPIQRITKYQLMLKELHRHSAEEFRPDLQAALASMLDLLGQLNADMRQLRISSFNGDISLLGNLRLQAECEVMNFKKKTKRYNKSQKRNIFLFDNAVLLCKKRSQPMPITPEYYEHKVCLPINCLGFSELSKAGSDKFEIWDESKADGFAVFIAEDTARMKWIQKLRRHIASTLEKDPNNDKVPELAVKTDYFDVNVIQRNKRPQSWTSTASTESTSSSRVSCEDGSIDPNGNRSSIASINEECQELERFEKCDAADNNSTHVTSIHIPPLDESNKDISTTNNHMIDTRSISDSGIQSRTGPITISESADCVSTAC
uniref:DH domain-containing protein n=1 Tax=Rhabditophanes sp. KR3021 TaxID=114890 RepID=A0AC35THR7_9BILA